MKTTAQRSPDVKPQRGSRWRTAPRGFFACGAWIAAVAAVAAPSAAWANWGEQAWGELTWGGNVLTEVPALGPIGIGLLMTLAVGAGMVWGRNGESRTRRGPGGERNGD